MRRRFATRFTRTFIAIFVAVSIVQGLSVLSHRDVALDGSHKTMRVLLTWSRYWSV